MTLKTKNFDYELDFEAGIDWTFWALPVSICFMGLPAITCLEGGFFVLLRILCFQFSVEIWKWNKEVTDVEATTVEDLFNG